MRISDWSSDVCSSDLAARGLVVTNHHVVENARAIAVGIGDRQVEAEFLGSDPRSDIAVLRIPARGLKQLPFGDADKTKVGDYVAAIGNPRSDAHTSELHSLLRNAYAHFCLNKKQIK